MLFLNSQTTCKVFNIKYSRFSKATCYQLAITEATDKVISVYCERP